MIRDVAHVDVDAFFASVEQVLNPALRAKAVIVGGNANDRSVVASASYEARAYGVRSAMPLQQARRLCPQAVFIPGHFAAYGEFSERVRQVLLRFTPVVETASLDDFYLDLTGCRLLHGPPLEATERIKSAVRTETQLTVTIAVAGNKLVAKIASDLAKPDGLVEIGRGCEEAFLRSLPVGRLPGVGPSTEEALKKYNLTTIGDIARLSPAALREMFGVWGIALSERAHGVDPSPVVAEAGLPKSISRETTFSRDTIDHEEVRTMLYHLAEHAARELREEGFLARRVTVKVRYADFKTATAAQSLSVATDRDDVFYEAATDRLGHLLKRRMAVRLVGVALSGILPIEEHQGELFRENEVRRRRRFYRGLDALRKRYGFEIARVGPSLRLSPEPEEERPPTPERRGALEKKGD